MAIAIIADAHLGGPGGRAEPLVAQLDELPERGCRRLVMLGDIFQAWVGWRKFETPEIRAVVPALERLRERGLEIDYVEGNRDFFLAGSPYAGLFDRLATEVGFTAGGTRYLAVHGDGLNQRDRKYLFWRWLSKSAATRLFARGLPAWLARWAMGTTERRLSRTNFKHKARVPAEAITSYGEKRLAEGYDVLFLGHFHEPRTWRVAGGEIRLLDAWFRGRRVEWVEE